MVVRVTRHLILKEMGYEELVTEVWRITDEGSDEEEGTTSSMPDLVSLS